MKSTARLAVAFIGAALAILSSQPAWGDAGRSGRISGSDPSGDSLSAAAERWWSHILFLADDKLEGRDTGSPGHRKAAQYVADHFAQAGLKPAGTDGYFQSIKFQSRRILEEQSYLAVVRDAKEEALILGQDAVFGLRSEPAPELKGPLVFAGYGLVVPESRHDDLAGLDLRGKIVVFLTGGPSTIPGPLLAHYQSARERWAFFKARGAVGMINIPNPKGTDIPWERSSLARLHPVKALAGGASDDAPGLKLAVTFNAARAEKLFAGSDHSFQEVLGLAQAGEPLPHFDLPASVHARVRFESASLESQNVIAMMRGSDPALRNEYVVLSAHLDHLGIGEPINGDRIYNGAMDNASGIATLLEIAAAMAQAKKAPRRSVLFLAVTAEEAGLLGSKYFAAHPTVKPGSIVADLNTDMFLPIIPLKSLIAHGLDESDLGERLREVASRLGLQVTPDPEPERNAFVRSDQYSFIRCGIPALSLKVGYAKGSPEAELVAKWRKERYHAPSDDVNQTVNFAAAETFNRVMVALAEAVANRSERPRWYANSFFRRFAESGQGK